MKRQGQLTPIQSSLQGYDQIKYLTLVQNCDKYDDHKGIQHILYVVVDLIFNLKTNIKTEDGLINGASCI